MRRHALYFAGGNTRSTSRALLAALVVGAVGCETLVKTDDRGVDPLLTECTLPTAGDTHVRFANLVPSGEKVDVCVRPAGAAWGRPVLRGGGLRCPAGFAYGELSARIGARTGKVDVRVVSAGSTCSAVPLSETSGLSLDVQHPLSLLRVRDAGQPEKIVAFADLPSSDNAASRLRVVNAMAGSKELQFVSTNEPQMPTKVNAVLIEEGLRFGASFTPNGASHLGTIDDHGYANLGSVGLQFGLAERGSTEALLALSVARISIFRTLYGIGEVGSTRFPPRGLFCEDGGATSASNPVLSECSLSQLGAISADVFSASLVGGFMPIEDARRPFILQAIAARTSDILCVSEVGRKEDREAIVAAAKEHYPYSHLVESNLDTPPTDATDSDGNEPPSTVAAASCDGVAQKKIDDAYQCLVDNCSSKPGDVNGVLQGGSPCLSTKCPGPMLAIYAGSRTEMACWNCLAAEAVSYATFKDNKAFCTQDKRRPYAFAGQSQVLLLSRFPLSNEDDYIFPSSLWRRAAIYAKAEVDVGKTVDVYCLAVSPDLNGIMPYTGFYSSDLKTGWFAETRLQVQKFIAWQKKKSGDAPAIIVGDFQSSRKELSPSGDVLVNDEDPETIDAMRAAFQEARPPTGFQADCTYCPKARNPYNGDTDITWTLRAYLAGFPKDSTVEAGIFFTEKVVPLPTGGSGPISTYFAFNAKVLRPGR